jgi:methylenetetrahydrofolate dehydrogenase (NADP+) / methenyltetrahydrofolate cyclohydrolase
MRIDGKAIANRIYDAIREDIQKSGQTPRLGILTCAPNFETEKYLALKEKKAHEVGIETTVARLDADVTTDLMLTKLASLVNDTDAVVVQLPLPKHIDTDTILQAIPSSHDVDALNPGTTHVLSPVVGAIAEIMKTYEVPLFERHVVVIGSGKLVGLPASRWFMEHGASVSVVTKDTVDISYYTKNADIIVSGAGVPNLLVPDMVKEGVVILDAGTSEEGGMLKGDAHPDCAAKASLLTPVPGGIGPITIAVLLRNVTILAKNHNS